MLAQKEPLMPHKSGVEGSFLLGCLAYSSSFSSPTRVRPKKNEGPILK